MVGIETQVNGRARQSSPVAAVASQAANVFGDALELAELQAKLAKADAANATIAAIRPAGLLILGACAALASLPVLTLGLASMVAALTVLTLWQSQLLVGALAAVAAAITIYVALRQMRRITTEFRRSADELAKNLAWAKVVMRSSAGR